MNLKKYISMAGVVLGLGLTSCVGDLDLQPNDPNLVNPSDPNFKANSLAMCYSGIAVSGITGAGSSYVSGLDPGTSAYLRLVFTLNEFCSDEMLWIWPDAGVVDITSCTWGINNGLLEGAYYRFLGHIAICNQYLANTAGDTDEESQQMRAEARVLRAYSYFNMLDLFGQSSFITEEAAVGESPVQLSRKELYDWLEQELVDIVDNRLISENPVYGRVGLDGAEGLLARLYLNAEVYSGTGAWEKCQERCENIIARHKGGGFEGSGLANHYLYLFARDNDAYMPGGSKKDENEILFGIAYDDTMTQSYGGPTFIIASTISNTHYIPRQNYGCSGEWSCIRGCQEMAERFYGISDADVRDDLWIRGYLPAGSNGSESWDAEDYSDRFVDFTGAWATTGGNAIIKFTGRTRNAAEDGGWDMTLNADGTYTCGFPATTFGSTDQPIIRLADIYLMYSECYVNGNTGDRQKALDYINLVRRRAGAPSYGFTDLTKKGIMDERSRELYLESTRRTDLIRNGMFTGPSQTVWQYKGSINNNAGTRISERNSLYPIPYAVIAAQPEFKQNPGY
ncbi:MAG: RagB/SusD family nutrient uptake outer membrane protein [Muribaculaceae bacterium]|nr:RagB/SusD family nutrient uptake outer membrane protein [Muribaculaceae bacterium]